MNLLSRFGGRVWDPWREMGQLQREISRVLNSNRVAQYVGGAREYPPVNLYVSDHDLLLTLEVPGIDPATVDVTVTGGSVTITGERKADARVANENCHRRERPCGQFRRALELPFEVDPTRTEAVYEKGVLKVKLTRPETQKPRKVTVRPA